MRVAAFTKYDRAAASTRQRVLQYLPALAAAGIEVALHPLLDDAYVRGLESGTAASKSAIAGAYARRLAALRRAGEADLIWVYAELFPWLPGVLERQAFAPGKPVVYDMDDAFFHAYDQHSRAMVRRALGHKLDPLIAGATVVCAGNAYLAEHARALNPATEILPTVVDTDQWTPGRPAAGRLTIGWIGSPSTWTFVRPVLPLLARLAQSHGVHFVAVGAGVEAERDRFDGMTLVPWSEEGEIAAVQAMDIGIMPLPDAPWARGKCGYKLIQYMACGLPVVASPVGVNSEIVIDGVNGFLAGDEQHWSAALTTLIEQPALRRDMGAVGRERVVTRYSLAAHAPRLVEIMRRAVAGRAPA